MNKEQPQAKWTPNNLREEYMRRGISYKKVRPRYGFRKAEQTSLALKDQATFLKLKTSISGEISGGLNVIFIDEVTFSMKTYKPYAWSHRADNITQRASLGSQPC